MHSLIPVFVCSQGSSSHTIRHCIRSVSILYEELYYDEDFESFRIMVLNFPLEGKQINLVIQCDWKSGKCLCIRILACKPLLTLCVLFGCAGKVPASYIQQLSGGSTNTTPIERRSLGEHADVLKQIFGHDGQTVQIQAHLHVYKCKAAPKPRKLAIRLQFIQSPVTLQRVLEACMRYIADFNRSYVMVKGFLSDTGG